MEHTQQQKRPRWVSLPLWQMLEAIEPNHGTDTVSIPPNAVGNRGMVSVTTPSGASQTAEVVS
jgi:hypothetical protein